MPTKVDRSKFFRVSSELPKNTRRKQWFERKKYLLRAIAAESGSQQELRQHQAELRHVDSVIRRRYSD